MNLLLEVIVMNGLIFDALGVIGLGLLALAALKLTKDDASWAGKMMSYGAIALLFARVYILSAPHFMTSDFLAWVGPVGLSLMMALPPVLLTFGFGGVVWGLWGYEKLAKVRD